MATEKAPPGNDAGEIGDGGRRAKSPVILDLEATDTTMTGAISDSDEVPGSNAEGEQPSPVADDTEPTETLATDTIEIPEQDSARSGVVALAGAAAIGGVIVLVLGFGLQAVGVLPVPGRIEIAQALTETRTLDGSVSAIDQRLTSIEAASAQTIADRALLDDLAGQVGSVDAFGISLSDRLLNVEASISALGERLDGGNDAVTKQLIDSLVDRLQRLENIDLSADNDGSVAALENSPDGIDTLANSLSTSAAGSDVVLPSSAPAIERDSAAPGAPVDAEKVTTLAALAGKGVPSRAAIAAEFPAIADAVLAALPTPDGETGFFDRILSYGSGLVKVRPAEPLLGDSPVAVLSRMRAAVDNDDLAGALAEREALPPAGQVASQEWAAKAVDRLAIDRLSDELGKAPSGTEGSEQGNSQ